MKNGSKFLSSLLALSAIALLSGCGIKPYAASFSKEMPLKNNDVVGKRYYVEGKEAWRSPSGGYNAKTKNIHLLQNAADLTLNEGYSYFSFETPNDLSNFKGNMMTTAQEFIEKCTPSEAQILDIGNGRCGLSGTTVKEGLLIITFKEAPKTILSYNAKEVKEYLKANALYREDGYEYNEAEVAKRFPKQVVPK